MTVSHALSGVFNVPRPSSNFHFFMGSWKKLTVSALLLITAILPARAAILLDDTWADGTRNNQNLPTDSVPQDGHENAAAMLVRGSLIAPGAPAGSCWAAAGGDADALA